MIKGRLNVTNRQEETTVGSYFVSNYPPYSFWTPDRVRDAHAALDQSPQSRNIPLGVYVHIPFCRKRCHFCYFKVYTGKNASEVEGYLAMAIKELSLYSEKAFIGGRKPKFIYFGGGTPSYISSGQLTYLVEEMRRLLSWDGAEEVTFECEPGTLTEGKLEVIKHLGVTRLSLGIENFGDHVLEVNGRAHRSKEVVRAFEFARSIAFPQINVDLIAGMMGETASNWRDTVAKTIDLGPDSVTIYQMEVPYNTGIFKEMKALGQTAAPVETWTTKREWVGYAFSELERAGYTVGSAYTAVKDPSRSQFLYRDLLWSGADLIGIGVASFSHVAGTHFQNEPNWDPYLAALDRDTFPIYRALIPNDDERMIREFILQMKLGYLRKTYFYRKFGVDVLSRFHEPLRKLENLGFLAIDHETIRLNRQGLLQVDRLLQNFFLPQHLSTNQ